MTPKSILAIGEVLWDIFPDGPRFGGAPANFACACAELGRPHVAVQMISAVGPDSLGNEARQRLEHHDVRVDHLATNDHLTGQVLINLDSHGRASYRFLEDSAWDYLEVTPAIRAACATADAIHFGTLGQRGEHSRAAIHDAVVATPPTCLRILDINLRAPYWSSEVIRNSLALANVLKLNDEELPMLAAILDIRGSELDLLHAIRDRYQLRLVALTRGPRGSRLLAADGSTSDLSGNTVDVVDTVGAGDAFTATLTLGLLHGLRLDAINRRAGEAAAFVCTQPGATPAFPARYRVTP